MAAASRVTRWAPPALVAVTLLISASPSTHAETPRARDLGWVSIELDPMTTPLGARNLLVYVEPPQLPHWSASIIAFAADFPDWMDDILSYRNRDGDFEHAIRPSPGITLDRFFTAERAGWHVGAFMFLWRHRVRRGGDEASYSTHVILPRVGYRWFPSRRVNFYVDPFAGVMFEYKIAGDNRVDGATHRPTPIIPFASVHMGYHF